MLRAMRVLVVIVALVAAAAVALADADSLAALLARTDAIAREVSRVRGLPLKRKVANEVLDRDELHARLLALAGDRKTKAQTAAAGLALARWGLIPPDTDYEQLVVDLLTDEIAGYYDPHTHSLAISKSAGDDPEWAEMVLAHELDHALQDQSFDLRAFEDLPDSEGDAALARHALVEGDGIVAMIEVTLARQHVAAPWSDPSVAERIVETMELPGPDKGKALDRAPLAVREALLFPYRAGFAFVAALRRRRPWSAVDAAYKRPPRSTEQILHVARYLADERPVAVAASAPPALPGYAIVESNVWGELGFDLWLRAHGVPVARAAIAADGWGGDRVVVLAKPGETRSERAVGLARFEWDTEIDAIEAHEAAVRALDDSIAGGTIEHGELRTRWLAIDGTQAWVERRGAAIVIVVGAPSWSAEALVGEAWTATKRLAQPSK
jgi:hypothetical protein